MVAYVKNCHSTAMNIRHYIWFLMQIFKIWSIFNVNSNKVVQTGLIYGNHRLHGYVQPNTVGNQKLVVM